MKWRAVGDRERYTFSHEWIIKHIYITLNKRVSEWPISHEIYLYISSLFMLNANEWLNHFEFLSPNKPLNRIISDMDPLNWTSISIDSIALFCKYSQWQWQRQNTCRQYTCDSYKELRPQTLFSEVMGFYEKNSNYTSK